MTLNQVWALTEILYFDFGVENVTIDVSDGDVMILISAPVTAESTR